MTYINSENLSSIIFFSYNGFAYGYEQANALVERDYGTYIQGLGTLSKTTDGDSYWDGYSDIIYSETEHRYNKLREVYNEGLTYMNTFIEQEDNIKIENGRYTSLYSYQHDLNNNFGNAEQVVFDDLKTFLCSLNWHTFNKQKMYNGENEINSVRIGAKTFYWYTTNDVNYSYNNIIEPEHTDTITYSYDYVVVDENNEQHIETYTTTYDVLVPAVYGNFESDNYYAYIRKEYVPIDGTLHENIQSYLDAFEDEHDNNPSIYTYYMNECNVVIPMTIDSRSIGTKKSTFMINFSSAYDGMYYDTINMNATISTETPVEIARITSDREGAVFTVKKNENESIGIDNVVIDEDDSKSLYFNGEIDVDETMSFTAPFDMRELDLSGMTSFISGELNLTETGWTAKGNNIKSLIIGNDSTASTITKISGINDLRNIESLDIHGLDQLANTPAISALTKLHVFNADDSNINTFKPAAGTTIYEAVLPETTKAIKLDNVKFDEGYSKVFGDPLWHFGNLDYEPTAALQSFSSTNNSTGINTHEFISKWIAALKAEDKLKLSSLIYLELQNIHDWKATPEMLYDLKQFDLGIKENRYGLEGQIFVEGSGNYGLLTIEEYSRILKLYGRHAFSDTGTKEKVFDNLTLRMNGIEPYDFNITVRNTNPKDAYCDVELKAALEYDDALIAKPTTAISFLEIVKSAENHTLDFTIDAHENYAYHKLSTTIDATDADESEAKRGDIMLFNGDTILVFLGTPVNNYKYVKIGHIKDADYRNEYNNPVSTMSTWNSSSTLSLEFKAEEKPIAVSKMTLTNENGRSFILPDSDTMKTLTITRTIDKAVENVQFEVKLADNTHLEYVETEIDDTTTQYVFGRKAEYENWFGDETVSIALKTGDAYITEPENLVKESFIISIAESSSYSAEDGTIKLSPYMYEVHNDILLVRNSNSVSITETEDEITIKLN